MGYIQMYQELVPVNPGLKVVFNYNLHHMETILHDRVHLFLLQKE